MSENRAYPKRAKKFSFNLDAMKVIKVLVIGDIDTGKTSFI